MCRCFYSCLVFDSPVISLPVYLNDMTMKVTTPDNLGELEKTRGEKKVQNYTGEKYRNRNQYRVTLLKLNFLNPLGKKIHHKCKMMNF